MSTHAVDGWGAGQQMNELEASMWRAENHPTNSLQGGILQVFDRAPRWDDVVHIHEQSIARFPRFRQRVVAPTLPVAPPVWAEDPLFDIHYHLRRVRLPEPGSMGDLLELAQTLGMTQLARNRALWTATLIEGLEGGGAAYFLTVHHCLMDGNAVMQLLAKLHLDPGHRPDSGSHGGDLTEPPKPARPLGLTVDQAVRRARQAPGFGLQAARSAGRALRANPADGARFLSSIGRVLAPPEAKASPALNSGTRSSWRYGTVDCAIDDLKAAGKAAGGTLNDAYVAAVLGGLRIYNEALDRRTDPVPVNMPVSVRRPDEEGGNRFSAAFLTGPAQELDPAKRIALINAEIAAIRAEPALDFFSLLLPLVNRAPASIMGPLFTLIQDRADLTISNVVGLPRPVTFSGAVVNAMYCFGPLPGTPVTGVLCSYAGRCHVGITCDGDVFTEPGALFDAIGRGFDEVLALAGRERSCPLVEAGCRD